MGALLLLAAGCSNDAADPIAGSGKVVESEIAALTVREVTVSLPFRAEVGNGEPGRLLLRGEDNLLARIEVEESGDGVWRIWAPHDLAFTQHDPIEIFVPYTGMVMLQLDGDEIELEDQPGDYWHEEE